MGNVSLQPVRDWLGLLLIWLKESYIMIDRRLIGTYLVDRVPYQGKLCGFIF